jgi:hypothetical protein
LPPPGKRFDSEIGKADFGRAAAWAEWISKRNPFAQTSIGLKPGKPGLSGGMDF